MTNLTNDYIIMWISNIIQEVHKMNKGKLGISLPFYAVVAFILAILGNVQTILLLLGFVIIAEGDVWTSKQVVQAFFLTVAKSAFSILLYVLRYLYITSIPTLGAKLSEGINFIDNILYVIITIFAIFAITRVAKGKDAGIPFAAKASDWACDKLQK